MAGEKMAGKKETAPAVYDESSIPFYGLSYQDLCGHHVITTGIEIRREVAKNMNLFLRANRGNITNNKHDLFDNDMQFYGGEAAYSLKSKIGMIFLFRILSLRSLP